MQSKQHNINSSKPENSIGIFDSGIGGLSVWREIVKLLPFESIIYFADSENCPYGSKSPDEIITLCDKISRFLISKNCKLIVVACNTATSAAIGYLRQNYPDINFVGMEPAVKPAALNSKTASIGILATAGTLKGRLFNETKARFAANVNVDMQIGEGLVELVEQGKVGSPEAEALLRKYIEPMLAHNIDHLVLGCTHYPFLAEVIHKIAGDKLILIDPAPAIAQRVNQLLETNQIIRKNGIPDYNFYSSGSTIVLKKMLDEMGVKVYNLFQIKIAD